MEDEVHDKYGAPVRVGTKVRVLKLDASILAELSDEEAAAALSMEGEVLEVTEIDEWGGAWVEKWLHAKDGSSFSHSLGLGPNQMEVVTGSGAEPKSTKAKREKR